MFPLPPMKPLPKSVTYDLVATVHDTRDPKGTHHAFI